MTIFRTPVKKAYKVYPTQNEVLPTCNMSLFNFPFKILHSEMKLGTIFVLALQVF